MKRVLKWDVPLDGQAHPIGAGRVVLVSMGDRGVVNVWTEEHSDVSLQRGAQVYSPGVPIPENTHWVGSCVDGPYSCHVYAGGVV